MNPSSKQTPPRQADRHWPIAVRQLQWHLFNRDVEPHREALMRYCRRLTGDRQSADDLMQETLLRGFRVVGSLWRGMDKPQAYLKRTARNLWIDNTRRAKEVDLDSVDDPVTESPELTLDSQLQLLLDKLTPTEYRVFVLQQLYGYTGPEIAELTNMTLAAVKMANSRAKRRLREYTN